MNPCIEVNNLEMRFGKCDALRGINLTVPRGTVFALLGENGAGKTTLIRILTGYQIPNRGHCSVMGFDPTKDSLELRRRIGYVSDSPSLYEWMRVDEIGWFASSFYPDGFWERFRESVSRFELPPDRKIRQLSKGQRAKVALSLALSHDPELLILDEPTSGLDPLVRREFMESMVERASLGKTVLLSSHQINEVERVADHVAIIHRGRVRIAQNLISLRESVMEITATLEDPVITLPILPEPIIVLSEQRTGRQIRWVIQGWNSHLESTVRNWPFLHSIRTRPCNLEEIFVAMTHARPNSNDPKFFGNISNSCSPFDPSQSDQLDRNAS